MAKKPHSDLKPDELTTEEAMERLFDKRVVEKMKAEAAESSPRPQVEETE